MERSTIYRLRLRVDAPAADPLLLERALSEHSIQCQRLDAYQDDHGLWKPGARVCVAPALLSPTLNFLCYSRAALDCKCHHVIVDETTKASVHEAVLSTPARSDVRFRRVKGQWQGERTEHEEIILGYVTAEDTLSSINKLVSILVQRSHLADAEPLCHEALEGTRQTLDAQHPQTLFSINNMGGLRYRQNRFADAEPFFLEASEGRRQTLGPHHLDTLDSIGNLSSVYHHLGRYEEAKQLHLEVLVKERQTLGDNHQLILENEHNFGLLLLEQGGVADSEPNYDDLGEFLAGDAEAESQFRELKQRQQALGYWHPSSVESMYLGWLYDKVCWSVKPSVGT